MLKKIPTLLFVSLLLFGMPFVSHANAAIEIIEQDFQNISISVSGSVLHVSGANNQILQIYNVAGVCVMNLKIEGNDKRFDLNLPKGCYIVKVGKTVRKISIK